MTVRIVPFLHKFANKLIQFYTTHIRQVRWHPCHRNSSSSSSSNSSNSCTFFNTRFFFRFVRFLLALFSRVSSKIRKVINYKYEYHIVNYCLGFLLFACLISSLPLSLFSFLLLTMIFE